VETEVTHEEKWHVVLRRGDGDDWPDMAPNKYTSQVFRPDRINGTIYSDETKPSVVVSGPRVLKNGLSENRLANRYYDAPDWARKLIQDVAYDIQVGRDPE
jgi:hypothetical protein